VAGGWAPALWSASRPNELWITEALAAQDLGRDRRVRGDQHVAELRRLGGARRSAGLRLSALRLVAVERIALPFITTMDWELHRLSWSTTSQPRHC